MDCCSDLAFLELKSKRLFNDDANTNILKIDFSILKNSMEKLHQGDPIVCSNCKSILNFSSVLKKLEMQQEKVEGQVINQNSNYQWDCEFCGNINYVDVEPEEQPKTDDIVYILKSAEQNKEKNASQQSIVFCLDNSGSMTTTQEIKGHIDLKHGMSYEELEMLKQFMEPGDEYQLTSFMNRNITYISRKQCVLAAIENQIEQMIKQQPNRIVGLVVFNDEVTIVGDGSNQPVHISGDRLNKFDEIIQIATGAVQDLMKSNVAQSSQKLIQSFSKLQEKGQTALGPGLLSAVQLALCGKPGSMVVICTDGLANKGLGSLEQVGEDEEKFYETVGTLAKQNGVTISIITIKGEGCKLDTLSKLTEITNGTIRRVAPENLTRDFSSILKQEVYGTKVQLFVRAHRGIKFRNQDQGLLENDSLLFKDIGNATANTEITLEYQLKSSEEIEKLQIDLNKLQTVPFQARIEYENSQGDKLMRVLTKTMKTTREKIEAESKANIELLHKHATITSVQQVLKGQSEKAYNNSKKFQTYVQQPQFNVSSEAVEKNEEFWKKSDNVQKLAVKKQVRQEFKQNTQMLQPGSMQSNQILPPPSSNPFCPPMMQNQQQSSPPIQNPESQSNQQFGYMRPPPMSFAQNSFAPSPLMQNQFPPPPPMSWGQNQFIPPPPNMSFPSLTQNQFIPPPPPNMSFPSLAQNQFIPPPPPQAPLGFQMQQKMEIVPPMLSIPEDSQESKLFSQSEINKEVPQEQQQFLNYQLIPYEEQQKAIEDEDEDVDALYQLQLQ